MSEFSASSSFLYRKQFFTRFYYIMSRLSLRSEDISASVKILNDYSGFGIEQQIKMLNTCYDKLRKCKEDMRTEFYALVKIVDTVNEYEEMAKEIFGEEDSPSLSFSGSGNVSSPITLKKYEAEKTHEADTPSATWKNFADMFFKNFKVTDKAVSTLDEFSKRIFTNNNWKWCEKFSDTMGGMKTIFQGVNIVKYLYDTGWKFSDGKINVSEILGITNGAFSTFKSFGKIVEKVCDVKIFPKSGKVAVEDTLKIFKNGNVAWGKITQWLPLVGTVFSSGTGYYDKYQEYSSDGDYTLGELCRTSCYGSLKGLSSLATNIPVIGTAWGLADTALQVNDYDVAEKLTNGIYDTIDNEFDHVTELIVERGTNDENFRKKFLNSSNIEKHIIVYSILCQDIVNKATNLIF